MAALWTGVCHGLMGLVADSPTQVLSFAGELLSSAESLFKDGLHPTEIADGYAKAGAKALEILDSLMVAGSGALEWRVFNACTALRACPCGSLLERAASLQPAVSWTGMCQPRATSTRQCCFCTVLLLSFWLTVPNCAPCLSWRRQAGCA
jgi:hypothetical protein